jgi:hypothetical protein
MAEPRIALYERLPEIYRIRDEEQYPKGQLKAYLSLVEATFGAIAYDVEGLYHDLFIETCDDWVVPYIGDLLGSSHLAGDLWTLRADVADTIALRRRKGTLSAIELLAYDLTGWGVHSVELLANMAWQQNLNHQRPDAGGLPPYGQQGVSRFTPVRGGTAAIRDPAMLSLLGTPFDPFAHLADVKPADDDRLHVNLPNLAIFLWRMEAYRIDISPPVGRGTTTVSGPTGDEAGFVARFDVHPLGRPVRLFNTARFAPELAVPRLSELDHAPGPMLRARLTSDDPAGNPAAYVEVETYDPGDPTLADLDVGDPGLQLHVPDAVFDGDTWRFRGANLCAWETGLALRLRNREVAIDPVIGRLAIGVATQPEADALLADLLLTYAYGAVGPVGAHPISREAAPTEWLGEATELRTVDFHQNSSGLQQALDGIENAVTPIVVEIQDSMVHDLDLSAISAVLIEDGGPNLRLNRSLVIRAASGQRPILRLAQPLRFRPTNVVGTNAAEQDQFDAVMDRLGVRLEGLTLVAGFAGDDPLIARAALNSLEILDATLDPGGFEQLDGNRAPSRRALRLKEPYGFADPQAELHFDQTPEVHIQRSILGASIIDEGYSLFLTDSILDAGSGPEQAPSANFALSGGDDPATGWSPPTKVQAVTFFGRVRAERMSGAGGVWTDLLEVLDNQHGCLKYSYFSGLGDRLPQNHACVRGTEARLRFTDEAFGAPAYAQIARRSDRRIRERGPHDDEMGAYGFLREAHKWKNLTIRLREFSVVGIRSLLVPVT